MDNFLPMRCGYAGTNRLDQFERAHRSHGAFIGHDVLQRSALNELHDQERHRAAHHAKVSDGNDILMANGGRRQSFLAKTGGQIGIVANEIGKNNFDRVLSLKKDVPRFVYDTHAALAQTLFKLIASIEDRLSLNRRAGFSTVIRTVIHVIGETSTTGWALFHSLVRLLLLAPRGIRHSAKRILAAAGQASKHDFIYC